MDPLQQRVLVEQLIPGVTKLGPPVAWQIVGVYHNVRSQGFREDNPEIYIPFWQIPWPERRHRGAHRRGSRRDDPEHRRRRASPSIRRSLSPSPETMDQVRDEVLANDRFTVILFVSFAVVALLLAALGIYGVMAFSVAQRSHEIALRMALGASRNRMVVMIVTRRRHAGQRWPGLGLIGAYFVGRAMHSMLFGVGAMDFSAFATVGLVLSLRRCWPAIFRPGALHR